MITKNKLAKLLDYIDDTYEGDGEWLMRHMSIIKYDDITKTMTIEFWDMDEIDYEDIKKEEQ